MRPEESFMMENVAFDWNCGPTSLNPLEMYNNPISKRGAYN